VRYQVSKSLAKYSGGASHPSTPDVYKYVVLDPDRKLSPDEEQRRVATEKALADAGLEPDTDDA